jgi:Fic family protein
MMSFESGKVVDMPISHRLLRIIREIAEYRGKQALFIAQSPQVLETLRQVAIIQSTECSNRIEGVTAPIERIKDLVAMKTTPGNRSEQEIAGYRDVLATIHANFAAMPFSANLVLQLQRDLYQFLPGEGGTWKPVDNEIMETGPDGTKKVRFVPVPAYKTTEAMTRLHERFLTLREQGEVDPLILIAAYVMDFLCIHPFRDGNGRMARLLTLLLLYQAHYEVGRYISLERIIEETRESYYETLQRSSVGWHEGAHALEPWTEYLLGVVILGAYQEFESRAGLIQSGKGTKTAMVLDVIAHLRGDFAIGDIQDRCPTVGIDMLRRILRQERDAGRLECLGRGPNARWRRIG